MKMYADYILERLGRDIIIIPETGFATFQIEKHQCYIVDIYVEKSARKEGYAKVMADDITAIAKRKGCKVLVGTVQTNTNNSDASEAVLLAYGMRFDYEVPSKNLKFFKKEI